jgi:hypothetical protein
LRNTVVRTFAVLVAIFSIHTHARDCAALQRQTGEILQQALRAGEQAQVLRASIARAAAFRRAIIARHPDLTLANLTAGMAWTKQDRWFGTDTARGVMLAVHVRILDAMRDLLASEEAANLFAVELSRENSAWTIETQLQAEADDSERSVVDLRRRAQRLSDQVIDCLRALAGEAATAARIREPRPPSTPTQAAVPPTGMTDLCQLTSGPRAGTTINLSEEFGSPLFVPIGDVCYDSKVNSENSIGIAISR